MDVEIVKPGHQEIILKIEDLRFAVDQFLSVSFAANEYYLIIPAYHVPVCQRRTQRGVDIPASKRFLLHLHPPH